MEKKGLLVVSFGTTYEDTRKKNIEHIEKLLARAFPDRQFYRAYTSGMIIRRLRERDGLLIPSVREAAARAAADGVTDLLVQPTHILNGIENDQMKEDVLAFEDRFARLSFGAPLLSSTQDQFHVIRSLMEELRWEICSRDEQLAMQFRDQMMQIPVQSLSSAQATAELLDTIRSRLSERGLICGGDALRSDSIGRACVYMHTHIAEKLTAQNMAAYVHISPRHFIRKFQSEMNESFSEYLRRIRIKAAIRMLEEGGDIKSIPAAVGYKDEKSFHAVFREYVGCSMREYQRKLNLSQREDTQP